ncbi:helix-turn-helix domain-containing protein [Paraburkholderia sediminicola]|uniref:helix-turn-helix domain-containing protein n=1 Tax=Paraburkholderia sediminicola TaxID=458836 RepID=UPI0038B8018D
MTVPHVADDVAEHSAKRRLIPHEVVSATADGVTPSRAQRQHLGLKQVEVAARLGISQPAYAYLEGRHGLGFSDSLSVDFLNSPAAQV